MLAQELPIASTTPNSPFPGFCSLEALCLTFEACCMGATHRCLAGTTLPALSCHDLNTPAAMFKRRVLLAPAHRGVMMRRFELVAKNWSQIVQMCCSLCCATSHPFLARTGCATTYQRPISDPLQLYGWGWRGATEQWCQRRRDHPGSTGALNRSSLLVNLSDTRASRHTSTGVARL